MFHGLRWGQSLPSLPSSQAALKVGPSSLVLPLVSCVFGAVLGCRNMEEELVSTNCADIFLGPTDTDLWSGHISITFCSPSPQWTHTLTYTASDLHQSPAGKGPLPDPPLPFPSASLIFHHQGSSLTARPHLHTLIHIVPIFLKSLLLPKSCSFLRTLNKSYFLKPMPPWLKGGITRFLISPPPKGMWLVGGSSLPQPRGPSPACDQNTHPHPSPIKPCGQFSPRDPPLRRTISQGQVYCREHTDLFYDI